MEDINLLENAVVEVAEYGYLIKFKEDSDIMIKMFKDGKLELVDLNGNLICYSNDNNSWVFPQ